MDLNNKLIKDFDPQEDMGKLKVASSVAYTSASQLVKMFCQFISVAVLGRILAPSEFGIVAMTGPIIAFVALFQDFGTSQAIVQKQNLNSNDISAAFWINIGITLLISIILLIIAPLAGAFYNNNSVMQLIFLSPLSLLITSLGGIQSTLLTRKMDMRTLSIVEIISAIIGVVGTILLALWLRNFWALFYGNIISFTFSTLTMWIIVKWKPSLKFDIKQSMEIFHFGANLTGFNLFNFFARNIDNVIIGKYYGSTTLGFYDRAYKLLLFPLSQIANPLGRTMVPYLSRLVPEPERYVKSFTLVHGAFQLIAFPFLAFAIASADILVPLVLGNEWTEAAKIFQILGYAGFFQIINNPSGWIFISQGRSKEFMLWGIWGSIPVILNFIISIPFGIKYMVIGYAVVEAAKTPFLWWIIGRNGVVTLRKVASYTLPLMFSLLITLVGTSFIILSLSHYEIAAIATSLFSSLSIFLILIFIFPRTRNMLNELVGHVKSILSKKLN